MYKNIKLPNGLDYDQLPAIHKAHCALEIRPGCSCMGILSTSKICLALSLQEQPLDSASVLADLVLSKFLMCKEDI